MPSAGFVPKKSSRASLSQRAPPVPDFSEATAKKADAESIERHMANFFADLNSNKVDLITTGIISIGTSNTNSNQVIAGSQQQQQQQGINAAGTKPLTADQTGTVSSPAAESNAKKPFDKSKLDKISQMLASKKQEVQASKTDLNDKLKSLFQKNGLTTSSSVSATAATATSNSSQPSAAPSSSVSPQISKKNINTSAGTTTTTTTSIISSPASAGAGGALSTKDSISLQPVLNRKEEYDPARPNDYEALKRAQQKKRDDMDKIREKKQLEQEEQENNNAATTRMDEEQDNDIDNQDDSDFYPPSLGLGAGKAGLGSSTNKQSTQAMEIEKDTGDLYSKTEYETSEEKAYKLMSKQGFKIGQGLGKQSQGIVAPIIAQKISDTSAIITQSSMDLSTILPQQVIIKRYLEQRNLTATKVVCLINLIAPYEIDETLEEEITEECFQFGVVVNLKIYVMAAEDCQDAVRVFIKYDSLDESSNAFTHLDGRIFNGRSVIGYFYSEEDFEQNQLANKL